MTAIKASEIGRRFTDPDKLPPVILVFGPDRGLVTEVTDAISRLFDGGDDPFAVVRLDAATIAADPARLVDEAGTISLFGARRLVIVRDAGGRNLSPALAPLLRAPPRDAVVVVEAGDLKRGVGLRKEVEDDRVAAAVYCPVDGEKELERMIDEEARALGLTVHVDARAALVDRLGADRAASRSEVLKACLYAAGTGALTLGDIDAVIGDGGVAEVSEAVDAAFLGQRRILDQLLSRVLRQDSAAVTLLMDAQRFAQGLELGAAAVADGTAPMRAADAVRPPLYGSHRQTAPRILERWTPAPLRAASALLAEAIFRTRVMPALAAVTARDAMMRLASFEPERQR